MKSGKGIPCRDWQDDIGDWCQEKIRTSGQWILMKIVDGNSVGYQTNLKDCWLVTKKLNDENKMKFTIHTQSQN